MRFSEHDRDAIEDVAAFCTTDEPRIGLLAVHITDGWAWASDAYRLDAREVDTDWQGALNPFTLRPIDVRSPDVWKLVRTGPHGGQLMTRTVRRDELPVKPRKSDMARACLGCMGWTVSKDGNLLPSCGCPAPLVDLRFLVEALQGADEPAVTWRWRAYTDTRPIRFDEDGHFHLLMPVWGGARKASAA